MTGSKLVKAKGVPPSSPYCVVCQQRQIPPGFGGRLYLRERGPRGETRQFRLFDMVCDDCLANRGWPNRYAEYAKRFDPYRMKLYREAGRPRKGEKRSYWQKHAKWIRMTPEERESAAYPRIAEMRMAETKRAAEVRHGSPRRARGRPHLP
jgi:hypothetical protein